MRTVLAVSASSNLQSVAVFREGARVALRERPFRRRQPRELLAEVTSALDEAGASLADVALFVGDVGPGSFTGIRAGLATLRALAYALHRPVASVTALDLVRASFGHADSRTVVALPGRAGHYFIAAYPPGGPTLATEAVTECVGLPELAEGARLLVGEPARVGTHEPCPPGREDVVPVSGPHVDQLVPLLPLLPALGWEALVPQYVAASDAERNVGVRVEAAPIPSTRA